MHGIEGLERDMSFLRIIRIGFRFSEQLSTTINDARSANVVRRTNHARRANDMGNADSVICYSRYDCG